MPVTNISSTWSSGKLVFKRKYSATASSVEFGVDDTGIDVKFFGATSGAYMLWDESADKLILVGATADLGSSLEVDAYSANGSAGISWTSGTSPTSMEITGGIITFAA